MDGITRDFSLPCRKEAVLTVRQLLRLLAQAKGPKAKQRVRAIQKLAPFANYSTEALQALINGLDDRNSRVRQQAAMDLGDVQAQAQRVIPHLIKALKDENPLVRYAAVSSIKHIEPESSEVVSALIEALEDHEIVHEAIEALGAIGPPAKPAIPVLLMALENKDFATGAAEALGNIGPEAGQAVPAIAQLLKSPQLFQRRIAAEALGRIGPAASGTMPLLMEAYQDQPFLDAAARQANQYRGTPIFDVFPDHPGQLQVGIALAAWRIGEHPAAIHMLVDQLHDEVRDVRLKALDGLGEIELPAGQAAAEIANLTRDSDEWVRSRAVTVLASLAPAIEGVLPTAISALGDATPRVRRSTASAIGELGSRAGAAVDSLMALLDDCDNLVRIMAALALWRIARHDAAISTMTNILSKRGDDWFSAAMVLAELGPAAHSALPTLLRLKSTPDIAMRCVVNHVITSITGSPIVN